MTLALHAAAAAASLLELEVTLEQGAKRALLQAAEAARAAAARAAPPRIARKLRLRRDGEFSLRLDSPSKATGFLEFGTKPHVIRPKKGKEMAFRVNGRLLFAQEIHHPGTKALGFMRKGALAAERTLTVYASGSL